MFEIIKYKSVTGTFILYAFTLEQMKVFACSLRFVCRNLTEFQIFEQVGLMNSFEKNLHLNQKIFKWEIFNL